MKPSRLFLIGPSQFRPNTSLFVVVVSLLITQLEAISPPLNHQYSPWYMQLREKESTPSQHATGPAKSYDSTATKICIEPSREIYQQFVLAYDRNFSGSYEELERQKLFDDTFKRTIILNDIVESSVSSVPTKESSTYSYIKANQLWYPDINDCELAYIKSTVTKIFDLVDQNEYGLALANLKQVHKDYPILTGESMRQACQILLIRLHDRAFEDLIKKWFDWQKYFKRLAAYDYNQKQLKLLSQSEFASQLELYAFVYPKFYKDIRFNDATLNKTNENIKILRDFNHVNGVSKKNSALGASEKNERIDIFRRRWTMAKMINDKITGSNQFNPSLSSYYNQLNQEQSHSRYTSDVDNFRTSTSGNNLNNLIILTRFSDLTDEELVAYINDNPNYVKNNSASIDYYSQFPILPLDNDTKLELVNEILLRRKPNHNWTSNDKLDFANQIISDIGLPIGSKVYPISARNNLDEVSGFLQAARDTFQSVNNRFSKNYNRAFESNRFSVFLENYPKIRAWQMKEGWKLNPDQSISMLRLADVTWEEVRFTFMKLCCLNRQQREALSDNSTIRYLLSLDICQTDNVENYNSKDKEDLAAMELYYYYLVNFNKHHPNYKIHRDRFINFRKNLEDLTRYSCEKDVVLLSLLKSNKFHMSMVDDKVIDDINLDRFTYFEIDPDHDDPNYRDGPSDVLMPGILDPDDNIRHSRGFRDPTWNTRPRDIPYSGRAGTLTTYGFFNMVYDPSLRPGFNVIKDKEEYDRSKLSQDDKDYEKKLRKILTRPFSNESDEGRRSYLSARWNSGRIYNFVSNRYRLCLKMIDGRNDDSILPQCRPFTSSEELEHQFQAPNYGIRSNQQHQYGDKCAFYKNGLEPYPSGMRSIRVPDESAAVISRASCRRSHGFSPNPNPSDDWSSGFPRP